MNIRVASARLVSQKRDGLYWPLSALSPGYTDSVTRSPFDVARPAAALVLAMLGRPGPLRSQAVTEVQITPETMTLGVAQKQTLFAAAFDRHGNLIAPARFSFWSSDTLIARVNSDGTVTGVRPGLAKVEARTRAVRASMAVLVTGGPAPDSSARRTDLVLELDPNALTLLPVESARVTAGVLRQDGSAADLGPVAWKSLRPDVATVDSTGLVVAVAPGRGILQASTPDGLLATAPVLVAQADLGFSPARVLLGPGETDTVRASVPSQGNRELRGGLQWRVADTSIARVGPSGVVEGRAPGTTELLISGYGQDRRVPVTVHKAVESVVVTPRATDTPIPLVAGATRMFSAEAQAADSTPVPEVKARWAIADSAVASFDPATSTLLARGAGATTLTARLPGFEPVVWRLEVMPGVLSLEPARVGLAAGERRPLRATLHDEKGRTTGAPPRLEWSSDHPEIVAVSPGGEVTAIRPGRATVTAKAERGPPATAELFVTGDLLLTSNRTSTAALYQARIEDPDSLMPLLDDGATNIQAALAPDRTRVAFSSSRNGVFHLFVMDADGRNPRRLTTVAGSEGEPAWTPDGSRLIYSGSTPGGSQLFSVGADGGGGRQLTSSTGGNQSPAVSPDGRSVAFISSRGGHPDLYLMDVDGNNQRRIDSTGPREASPRFFPNGDIAVVVQQAARAKGSRIVRLTPGSDQRTTLVESGRPIVSVSVSREGTRLAYVTGLLTDARKGRAEFGFFLQSSAPGSRPEPVALRPGEQILGPSF